MKTSLILILSLSLSLSLSFSFSLSAQSSLYNGGYGHIGVGPGWYESEDFTKYLQKPGILGPSLNWNSLGYSAGAEGYAEIRGLLLGGGGYGLALPSQSTDSSSMWTGMGAAYFKTGYVFFQNGRQFAALMGGFGGGALGVNIKNNSYETDIAFDPQDPIRPGQEKGYYLAYALFDFSLNYKVVASNPAAEHQGRYSGFMFGIDIGSTFGVRMDEWRHDGNATSNIPSPDDYFSPYLRITIGGGGFKRPADLSKEYDH
jgi:hypothetical protein